MKDVKKETKAELSHWLDVVGKGEWGIKAYLPGYTHK